MAVKVAINGFGRIGRLVFRSAALWPEFDWVLVNDPKADAATCAHLLNFDSVQGRWTQEAAVEALRNGRDSMLHMRDKYRERRDFIVRRFNELGLP